MATRTPAVTRSHRTRPSRRKIQPNRSRRDAHRTTHIPTQPKEIVMKASKSPLTAAGQNLARRRLLGWLAGSPLFAAAASTGSIATLIAAASRNARAQSYDALRAKVATGADGIITAPHEALNVFEFEAAAKKTLFAAGAPTHWGYL